MALVYSCNNDVAAAAFISGLQVTNPFYKHLVNNDITKMRDILVREVHTDCRGDTGCFQSSSETRARGREAEVTAFPRRGIRATIPSLVHKPARRATESNKRSEAEPDLIPFRVPIDHIFNVIKDQFWVTRPPRTREDLNSKTTVPSAKGGATSQ